MTTVLVTGANGFIGTVVVTELCQAGHDVRALVRSIPTRSTFPPGVDVVIGDIRDADTMKQITTGREGVVHLAGRAHVMTERALDSLQEFRKVNLDGTKQLARVAASQGVRRFVYLSSIKVNGEESVRPFTEQDLPGPQDPYGMSKWEAEQAIAQVSAETGMEAVVIRSPLVYGPGVKGNFLQLLNILQRQIPLPLASVRNRRSLVYRGTLVDALICCVQDKRAAGQTYLVSDGEDLSTPELIRRLSRAMGVKVRVWPFPIALLHWMEQLAGKKGLVDRLLGSLQVDSSKIRRELGWHPPFSVDTGLSETAMWFRSHSAFYRAS